MLLSAYASQGPVGQSQLRHLIRRRFTHRPVGPTFGEEHAGVLLSNVGPTGREPRITGCGGALFASVNEMVRAIHGLRVVPSFRMARSGVHSRTFSDLTSPC